MNENTSYKVTLGGWYQRTTLHLTEIYDFFDRAYSKLPLDKNKLGEYFDKLNLKVIERKNGYLEYVYAKTQENIEIKYYEDGLYTLSTANANPNQAKILLERHFQNIFNPAINFIFSLGAPTPKILANIKPSHPVVISEFRKDHTSLKINEKLFGKVYSKISTPDASIYKTPLNIFVILNPKIKNIADILLENQIFFREFKDQLEKYLNIHRTVWEEINIVKEKRKIKGYEIEIIRNKLDGYEKTISLIKNRINQMDTYLLTRKAIASKYEVDTYLSELFQYKFETLLDTHKYIKEIWVMTEDFLKSAISIVVEIKTQVTNSNLRSLTLITTMGVMSGIVGYLSRDKLPSITKWGIVYFLILMFVTGLLNLAIVYVFRRIRYKLNFSERKRLD